MLTRIFTTPENESNELRKAYQMVQQQFADLALTPDKLMSMAISCTEIAARKNLVTATYYANKELPEIPESTAPMVSATAPSVVSPSVPPNPLTGASVAPMPVTPAANAPHL